MICATTSVLVHEFTPHLQHDGMICILDKGGHGNCGNCHHSDKSDSCSNDLDSHPQHSTELEVCELLKYINHENELEKSFFSDTDVLHQLFPILFIFISPADNLVLDTSLKYKISISQYLTYKSPLVNSIFGLRAPPFFI